MYNRTGARARNGFESSNQLLAVLPPDALLYLRSLFEPVALLPGEVLCEAGEVLERAYFIEAGVVALMALFKNGIAAVMTTVGREGMLGVSALTGNDIAVGRQVVRVQGSALAVEISHFRRALETSAALRAICEGYARALLGQVLQTIACNGVHTIEERCARWLLMSHDRSDDDTCALTEELLAQMAGNSPAAASAVTQNLQKAGLISRRPGLITVVDRPGLEAAACECYLMDRARYRRILPDASD
jgi:CRP-like cAMP-binding protein